MKIGEDSGGGSGIGRAALALKSARIVIADIDEDRLNRVFEGRPS
jgi:hypothetical protein